ncbi:hypothetical protein ACQ4PT_012773 [Festuca glaucescens]
MAALTAESDDGGGAGGAGAGGSGVAHEDAAGGDFADGRIRISTAAAEANLRSAAQPSPEQRAATAFARAVLASPSKSSHQWASSFGGGVDLDDEIWEIRFHFSGEDNLERTISRSDITVLNLLALVEQRGYGIRGYMYYVKERGKGKKGMEVVDSMSKVDEMLELYDSDKVLNLTVVKHKAEWPIGLNREDVEAKDLVDVPVVLSDNKSGINFMAEEVEEVYPVAIDYSDVLYIGTQQSSNMNKGKAKEVVESDEDEEELEDGYDSDKEVDDNEVDDNEGGYMYYDGEYRPELAAAEREVAIEAELELMKKLRKQRHARENAENEEIMEKLNKMKEQKADPFLHFEGDTDVEEMFEPEEDSEVEEITEKEMPVKKKAAKCRPSSRSHHEVVKFDEGNYFMPSSDEDSSPDELGDSDDDGFVSKFHTKVTIDWLAKQSEQAVRIDPNTTVDTLIDNAKQKWGVTITKSKAYRAMKIAFSVVMGDQKAQYTRLRDYLQAVIDTNPGSRCIVTTKHSTRHTEDGNTSASASTAADPPRAPARAPPAPAPARAPPAPARARAPPAPARARAPPAPTASRASAPARAPPAGPRASAPARAAPAPPRAPPARFSATRTTTVSDPGTAGRRVSGRKRLLTGRMKGYLTAGKFTYRQDPPTPAPDA